MSKIVNSSAGNDFFDINGSAVSSTNQPKLDGGAVAGVSSSQIVDGKLTGYRPETSNPTLLVYSGTQDIVGVDTSPVHVPETKTNQVYKVRSLLQASGIRANQFNFQSGVWNSGFPLERDDTEEIQIDTSSSTYPIDRAIDSGNRVSYKYGIATPTTTLLSD